MHGLCSRVGYLCCQRFRHCQPVLTAVSGKLYNPYNLRRFAFEYHVADLFSTNFANMQRRNCFKMSQKKINAITNNNGESGSSMESNIFGRTDRQIDRYINRQRERENVVWIRAAHIARNKLFYDKFCFRCDMPKEVFSDQICLDKMTQRYENIISAVLNINSIHAIRDVHAIIYQTHLKC